MNPLIEVARQIVALKGVHADESWHIQHGQFSRLCTENAVALASAFIESQKALEEALRLLENLHADLEAIHRSQKLQPPATILELRNLENAAAFLSKHKDKDNG